MVAVAALAGLMVSDAMAGDADADLMRGLKQAGGRSGGKPHTSEPWSTIRFGGTTVTFPKDRELRYELDRSVTPHHLKIWNEVGDTKVPVYAAIYLVKDGRLYLTFNAGEDYPTKLKSDKTTIQ